MAAILWHLIGWAQCTENLLFFCEDEIQFGSRGIIIVGFPHLESRELPLFCICSQRVFLARFHQYAENIPPDVLFPSDSSRTVPFLHQSPELEGSLKENVLAAAPLRTQRSARLCLSYPHVLLSPFSLQLFCCEDSSYLFLLFSTMRSPLPSPCPWFEAVLSSVFAWFSHSSQGSLWTVRICCIMGEMWFVGALSLTIQARVRSVFFRTS